MDLKRKVMNGLITILESWLKIYTNSMCLFNIHDYEYNYQKVKGISDFGEHETNIYCRFCKNCKKRQMEDYWGWETF